MRRFDELSAGARAVWAKSGDPSGHGLLAHMLDVAAVAERLLQREGMVMRDWGARQFGVAIETAPRFLAALVGLHDIGKAVPGFQAKWPEGQARDQQHGLLFPGHSLSKGDHDAVSAAVLSRLLRSVVPAAAGDIAKAVAAHHGHIHGQQAVREALAPGEPLPWSRLREELFAVYWHTLAPSEPIDGTPSLPALVWLAGLTSVSDWIGSSTDWFPIGERAGTLADHHRDALARADAALDAVRWPASAPLRHSEGNADDLVGRMLGLSHAQARPLQVVGERLLGQPVDPVLMIVEAPMGEGKTELAFLAHLRLQHALGHRGLYIGLPTQATGNAMFDRTLAFLRSFGHGLPLDIQLAHGGAMLQEDRVLPLRDIAYRRADSVGSSAWFAQRRRPLLSPYGVGTIDQALLATLNVQHHFVRLWGLANRVVVLDEVHAYDTYTSSLIEALLGWLRALRCSVVLMSATLPAAKREALLCAWGAPVPMAAPAYPRVTVVEAGTVRADSFATRGSSVIRLADAPHELDALADRVALLAADDGCGAVVVNTVDRAQRLFELLAARLAGTLEPMLFHARYPGDERQAREQAVLATFGREASRPRRALLIATQVVEQSLDIDFDYLVSDLAPMDLLLQRAGRLHRHDRTRPEGHRRPALHVAGRSADALDALKRHGWASVYGGEWVLLRTWAALRCETELQLPNDIDRLVQSVYGGSIDFGDDEALSRRVDHAWAEFRAREQIHARQGAAAPIRSDGDLDTAYSLHFRGDADGVFNGLADATRLGPESLVVVPVVVDGGLWRAAAGEPSFDPAMPLPEGAARRLVQRQVRLSRKDLVLALKASAASRPRGFVDHPWLQHCHPLPLADGQCMLGALTIRLHPALGVVYVRADREEGAR